MNCKTSKTAVSEVLEFQCRIQHQDAEAQIYHFNHSSCQQAGLTSACCQSTVNWCIGQHEAACCLDLIHYLSYNFFYLISLCYLLSLLAVLFPVC